MDTVVERPGQAKFVVRPAGELDLATAPRLEEVLKEVEVEHVEEIVLDCSSLTFLDSTGLRVLLAANTRASAGGWRFSLASPGPNISRLLTVTGLDARLHIIDGLQP